MDRTALQNWFNLFRNPSRLAIEYTFVFVLLVLLAALYYETRQVSPEAGRVPQLMIFGAAITSVLWLVHRVFNERTTRILEWIDAKVSFNGSADTDPDLDGQRMLEEQVAGFQQVDLRQGFIFSLWIIGYLLGIQYIGFFTANFAFVALFVYTYSDVINTLKKIALVFGVSTGNCLVLYILFVEILNIGYIFRFGFFI